MKDVDFACISDSYWLGERKPCITYGLRYLASSLDSVFILVCLCSVEQKLCEKLATHIYLQ